VRASSRREATIWWRNRSEPPRARPHDIEEIAMPESFDAIVIGTGQSGPSLAVRFANAGQRVLLIERKQFGGTCVNNGCIPTKTLVASARVAHVVRTAARYGVDLGGAALRMDMKAVKARKDEVVAASVDGLTQWFAGTKNLRTLHGHARFSGPRQVEVDGAAYEAEKIFINVGGRASVPPWPGLADIPYLNNSSMMGVDFLPDHLVIIGGSYIGLEFAQMYRRFGSQVTVIEASPRLIAREDPDTSAALQALLESEGIEVQTGAAQLAPTRDGSGVRVAFERAGVPHAVHGSHLLLAVGRLPNTGDLGLEKAGIAHDARGYITVDDELRTNVEGVWALGDVNGRGAFTHTSYNDYEIVAANLLDGGTRRLSDRIMTYALYTDPPLGRAGMNDAEARASGKRVLVGTLPMARVGRAHERGETTGFMRALVDAESGHILGATLFGIEADEVVQSLLLVMQAKLPYTLIQRTMLIHPTVSELLPTLFADLKPLT
jgi:pyruvate/2-oxoglutarate dehydrogenase complex dihydrolipoamide dehydrogenase (E3) component